MARYLIDEYGEVLAEFDDNVKITSYDFLNTKRRNIMNKLFFKLYRDSTLILSNEALNYKYIKTFFKLIRYLELDSNEILKINGLPAMSKQLSEALGISSKTFYNHLKMLERYDLIHKIRDGRKIYVMINPYFIGYGTNHSDEALRIFSNSAWAKCSNFKYKNRRKKYEK